MPSTPPPSLTHQHVSLQSSPVVHRHRGLRAGAAAMAAAAAPTFRLTQCLRCSRRLRCLHDYRCLPHQSRPPDADDADGADGADDRAAQAPVRACALLPQVAFMATSACDGRDSGWAWSGVVGVRGKGGGRMQRAPALSVAWRRSSQPSALPSHAASSRARSGRRPRQSFRRFITALVCFVPRPRLSFRLSGGVDRPDHVDRRPPSVGRSRHSHVMSMLCLAANNSCSQGRWHPTRRTEGAHSARALERPARRRHNARRRANVRSRWRGTRRRRPRGACATLHVRPARGAAAGRANGMRCCHIY